MIERAQALVGGLAKARAIVLANRDAFIDPAYAGGVMGAFGEIFACNTILREIDEAIDSAGGVE